MLITIQSSRKPIKCLLILMVAIFMDTDVFAQVTFTESAGAYGLAITGTKDGGLSFADYDGDGDMDVLINAASFSNGVSYLYRNDGGTFTNVTATLAPRLSSDNLERQAVWGDLNNDGFIDFMRTTGGTGNGRMEIYLQDSATGKFGRSAGSTIPIGIGSGAANDVRIYNGLNCEGSGFFDFDGDGDLDVYFDNHNFGVDILRNNYIDHTTNTVVAPAYGSLFTHITTGTSPVFGLAQSATDGDYAASADVNNDGWVDLFIRKRDENDFFLNQGGAFTNGQDLGQASNANKGGVALFDLDNDGDFDAIWTDNGGNHIYQNNAGVFTKLIGNLSIEARTDIDGVDGGDFDNDGDIDLVFTGDTKSYIYINQLNSPTAGPNTGVAFGMTLDATFDGAAANSGNGEGVVVVDIDNDGDMDFYENKSGTNRLWINNLYSAATLATSKSFLVVHAKDNRAYLNAGHDRYALGANIVIKDCDGNVISGIRNVNGGSGHGTQNPLVVHFGLPYGLNALYFVEVSFPNYVNGGVTSRTVISRIVNPAYDGSELTIRTTDIQLSVTCEDYDLDRDTVPNGYDIDDDDDGILDITEIFNVATTDFGQLDTLFYDGSGNGVDPTGDNDRDGVPNYLDMNDTAFTNTLGVDANNDGVADFTPAYFDKDMDGIPNFNDLDSDNDGIPDIIEANGTDIDANGRVDIRGDIDGDGLLDAVDVDPTDGPLGSNPCATLPHCLWTSTNSTYFDTNFDGVNDWDGNTDNDALMDFLDLDSDNDGLQDLLEAGGQDIDRNGYVDQFSITMKQFAVGTDTEGDGWTSACDGDTDNDDVRDNLIQLVDVSIALDVYADTDRDGIPDFRDLDSDGDGIPDLVEAGGADADGDGRCDNVHAANWDTDNDGWSSFYDGDTANSGISLNATNALLGASLLTSWLDMDGDNHPNHLDIDSDNDGVLDVIEIQSGNNLVYNAPNALSGTDSDGDGLDDFVDADNTDGTITTAVSAGVSFSQTGVATAVGKPSSLGEADDFDNDGIPNHLDIDSDNDGILDVLETQSSDYAPATAGNFPSGYGNPSATDVDAQVGPLGTGDGLLDLWDNNTTTLAGSNGKMAYDDNDDIDGAPDYLDLNSDGDYNTNGDTLWDYIEHFDFNRDSASFDDLERIASTYVSQNGGANASNFNNATDTDGDGYADWYDGGEGDGTPNFLDPSTIFYFDADGDGLVDLLDADQNGGTPFAYLGYDLVVGTVLAYPVNIDNAFDPDFRTVITLAHLPVDLVAFDAQKVAQTNKLTWKTASENNSSHFEVERSYDNISFAKIGQVIAAGNTQSYVDYFFDDNTYNSAHAKAYYRLVQVDLDGVSEISETRIVLTENKSKISVFPNPATDYINVSNIQNFETIEIVALDGSIVMSSVVSAERVDVSLEGLRSGTYIIKISNNHTIEYRRLLVAR